MALEGTLKDFSLADIFQLIGIQRKTGVLTLRNNKEVATISFINGMVVGADTDNQKLENRLGHVLVKTNRISQQELEQALAIQNSTLQRLGQVLISKGFIKTEDLRESLQTQVSEIIYRLFRWTDGDYHFRQERYIDYDQENFSPISAESLLMEGIRMLDEWPMIERVIPNWDILIERTSRGKSIRLSIDRNLSMEAGTASSFDDILQGVMADDPDTDTPTEELPDLNREQESVLKLIDGPIIVQDVIDHSRLNEFDTCRAIYDLIEMDLVQKVTAPSMDQEVHIVETEKPLPIWIPAAFVFVLAIASFLIQWNPLNRFFPNTESINRDPRFFLSASEDKLAKLSQTIDQYYLSRRELPVSLKMLVEKDVIREKDLSDPLDRKYHYYYRPEEPGYLLYGLNWNGQKVQGALTYEKTFAEQVDLDLLEDESL